METQIDTLKELVKKQQEHIKMLEHKLEYQDKVIKQYQSELDSTRDHSTELITQCSERLREVTSLRDSYRQTVSEIEQIKDEYNVKLAELMSFALKNG